jgi:hypothetical protein
VDDLIAFLTTQVNQRQALLMQAVKQGKLGERLDRSGSKVVIEMRIRGLGDTELDVVNQMISEIEAFRDLLKVHQTTVSEKVPGFPLHGSEYWCETCHVPSDEAGSNWCQTLRLLAMPYAEQPGYREKWRP